LRPKKKKRKKKEKENRRRKTVPLSSYQSCRGKEGELLIASAARAASAARCLRSRLSFVLAELTTVKTFM